MSTQEKKEKIKMETECKYPVEDLKVLKEGLQALGAEIGEEILEKDLYFDRPSGDGKIIRLRLRGDQVTLAYKGLLEIKNKARIREEIEVQINSITTAGAFEDAQAILEKMGHKVAGCLEKRRQNADIPDSSTVVRIDTLPFIGTFVEIEGSADEIRQVAQKLGFDPEIPETRSYQQIFDDFCNSQDLDISSDYIAFNLESKPS